MVRTYKPTGNPLGRPPRMRIALTPAAAAAPDREYLPSGGRVRAREDIPESGGNQPIQAGPPATLTNGNEHMAKPAGVQTGPKPDDAIAIGKWRLVDVGKLVPYAKNARTHSPAQIAKLVRSIQVFGFTTPIHTDGKRGILAGHGRVLAAQQLGMAQIPCVELSHLSRAQQRAYILADNRLAELAGWDGDLLREGLEELRDDGEFDLSVLGWSLGELAGLMGETLGGRTDPDDAPEAPPDPVSRLGDVWLLGPHRLVCGDCTQVAAVDDAMGDDRPHLMVTDPPYGVDYDPAWRSRALKDGRDRAEGTVSGDGRADWREAWRLFMGDVAYVWHLAQQGDVVIDGLREHGFEARAQIIWGKHKLVLGRGDYHQQHEPCWYAVRRGRNGHWQGDRTQTTLWAINVPIKSETGHGTQKPVECMARPIQNNSEAGDHVYDPFVGSGTTIIACEMTGRVCHAVELLPGYVDVAIKRWQAFGGGVATLEGDGRPFSQVGSDRASNKAGGAVSAPPELAAGMAPAAGSLSELNPAPAA